MTLVEAPVMIVPATGPDTSAVPAPAGPPPSPSPAPAPGSAAGIRGARVRGTGRAGTNLVEVTSKPGSASTSCACAGTSLRNATPPSSSEVQPIRLFKPDNPDPMARVPGFA